MDNTLMIAVVTASAGVLGGLTSGAISIVASTSQARRGEAAEERRWHRELAEKDRERLREISDEMTTKLVDLGLEIASLADLPLPQSAAQQGPAYKTLNEFVILQSRAEVLGATNLGDDSLLAPASQMLSRLKDPAPLEPHELDSFTQELNVEYNRLLKLFAGHLVRLRL